MLELLSKYIIDDKDRYHQHNMTLISYLYFLINLVIKRNSVRLFSLKDLFYPLNTCLIDFFLLFKKVLFI